MEINKINENIGKKIRYCRLNKGMTLSQLAKVLDVSPQQVSKYEVGKNKIFADKLIVIAKTLNTDISFFYRDLDISEDIPKSQREYLCLQIAQKIVRILAKQEKENE